MFCKRMVLSFRMFNNPDFSVRLLVMSRLCSPNLSRNVLQVRPMYNWQLASCCDVKHFYIVSCIRNCVRESFGYLTCLGRVGKGGCVSVSSNKGTRLASHL